MRERFERLADEGAAWRYWYSKAGREIAQVAERSGWERGRLADVLAIASPRCAVRRSVRVAFAWLDGRRVLSGVLGSVVVGLERYDEDPKGFIWGPKTGAYSRALRGDHGSITLDRWMAAAAQIDPKAIRSRWVAEPIEDEVRRVAIRRDWTPRQAQAAIWAGAMREAGRFPLFLPVVSEFERV